MLEYHKLLSCWHKLEHFSPSALPKTIKNELSRSSLPWDKTIKPSGKNKRIEHTIFLGVFHSSEVNNFVKDYFKDTTVEHNRQAGFICYASLKVGDNGIYLNDSLGISTLPWALSQLENNKLNKNDWAVDFKIEKEKLIDRLDIIFRSQLSYDDVIKIQYEIIKFSGWSVKPEISIYTRTEEKLVSTINLEENKTNSEILNSFYINDIEKILKLKNTESFPLAFSSYLNGCLNKESPTTDLSKNTDELINHLSPQNIPDGCWPSDYNLSLMQQYAVNKIFKKLAGNNQRGIFSVNGPPGTGKTTLLRDMISANIVKRAKALMQFEIPHEAFTWIGKFDQTDSDFKPHIYSLDESLCNTGAVIASSNNGAVENVSKELPLKKETGSYADDIGYFRQVSETCVSQDNWGLISAVLGNKENRNNLVSNLWFNKDKNIVDLRLYLKNNTKTIDDWFLVKKDFNTKLLAVEAEKIKIDASIEAYRNFIIYEEKHQELLKIVSENEKAISSCATDLMQKESQLIKLKSQKEDALTQLSILKETKPGFFHYWFNKAIRKSYKANCTLAMETFGKLQVKCNQTQVDFDMIFDRHRNLENKQIQFGNDLSETKGKSDYYNTIVIKDKDLLKGNYGDRAFWNNINTSTTQTACPWYSDSLKKAQSELFIAAINLHETFICVANSKSSRISTTLSAFFDYLKDNNSLPRKEAKALWDVFFLIFPVVSTTFASIQTMFRDLEKEDIPWLFIDEAGQAIPQAAAGSIYRSKRVVVVGDPLQIEPVVTISPVITNNISKYFNLSQDNISSDLSVQAMADRVNPFGMFINNGHSNIWVGIPLKVHRRCINPMFDISNSIAYANNMYLATDQSKIPKVNFESKFIHQTGVVDGRHWVKEHGLIVQDLLIEEVKRNGKLPDVFVITPFTEIGYQLRRTNYYPLVNCLKLIQNSASQEIEETVNTWLKTNIGTVHTFQGKQAEGVILCLGLDDNSKAAASWASNKPNLLNVALTRAKYRFVAIGDEKIWLKQPYFSELKNLSLN